MTSLFFVLDARKGKEAFVDPLFSAKEKMEDDHFCSGGETLVEEDYLNYKGSNDILYDFGLAEVMFNLKRLRRRMYKSWKPP